MRTIGIRLGVFVVAIAAATAVALAQGAGQGQQGQGQGRGQGRGGRGGPPQNLQVLPKDWTTQQVQQVMRTFTAGLGVQCDHCHVSQQDRASDDKPEKLKARKMLLMLNAINNELLKDVGEPPAPGTTKVTCFTCHRGTLKPLTAPAPGGGGGGLRR
jgi:hypothetical protein